VVVAMMSGGLPADAAGVEVSPQLARRLRIPREVKRRQKGFTPSF
jgi:hypothetical protein